MSLSTKVIKSLDLIFQSTLIKISHECWYMSHLKIDFMFYLLLLFHTNIQICDTGQHWSDLWNTCRYSHPCKW